MQDPFTTPKYSSRPESQIIINREKIDARCQLVILSNL